MSAGWQRVRKWAARLIVLAVLGGGGFGVYRLKRVQARATYPTATVRKGDFLVLLRCRGVLAARRSVGIYTPMVPNLRIAWMAPAGENVKAGDPILRFDSSTARQQLMQKEAQLKQAQATLDQAVAQAKMTAQQDETQLADAKFGVELAATNAKQQEVLSKIAGAQAQIDLGVAQQKLKLQEATVALHRASEKSRIASLTRQREQIQTDVDLTGSRIAQMELKAPIGGLLIFRMNYSGIIMSTAEASPYKVGDNVSSNMILGQIPDLNTLEMSVRLEEADRGRVSLNQEVLVRLDGIAELTIPAKISDVTRLAELALEYPYTRSFRAYAAIPHPDPRLRPDMNGGLDVVVNRIPNALSIPSKALFTRAGKPVVYVSEGGVYRAAEVEVLARNPDEVAISGVPAGSAIAMVDVAKAEQKKK